MLLIAFTLLTPDKHPVRLYAISTATVFLKLCFVYFVNLFKQSKQPNLAENERPINLCQIEYF